MHDAHVSYRTDEGNATGIPYPSEINYHADHHEERRRRALRWIDAGDVIATVESMVADEPDPTRHPLFPLVNWLLDRQWTPDDGGAFWDAWKRLACQAIDRCVDERLAMED